MRFGLVRLIFKKSFKPNQCSLDWFGLCDLSREKKYYISSNIANLLQNKHIANLLQNKHRTFYFTVYMIKY